MNEIFFKVRNKKRHYLHFDDKYSASFLFNYICNPNNINQHSFYPFIHYQIGEKKYRKASIVKTELYQATFNTILKRIKLA